MFPSLLPKFFSHRVAISLSCKELAIPQVFPVFAGFSQDSRLAIFHLSL